jgi:hypothetical protein
MKKAFTITEIDVQVPSEWILLDDSQTNETQHLQSGKVLWHSKDRDEVYRKAVELRPKHFAIHYAGTIPEGTAVVF